MQADTIFIISDGAPSFERALFGKELEEYQRRVAEAQEKEAKVTPKERERIDKSQQGEPRRNTGRTLMPRMLRERAADCRQRFSRVEARAESAALVWAGRA